MLDTRSTCRNWSAAKDYGVIVSRRAQTAVVPSGFVTMTSHSRLFFGPPERISSVAVSCVEPSRTTFSTRGVWPPGPFTHDREP